MVLIPNAYTAEVILTLTLDMDESTANPRTELDSHANMIMLRKNSFVFESTGRIYNIQPFSTDLGMATNVPILDGALAYDYPYTGQVCIILVRNALHISTIDHNLVPPFIILKIYYLLQSIPQFHYLSMCLLYITNQSL